MRALLVTAPGAPHGKGSVTALRGKGARHTNIVHPENVVRFQASIQHAARRAMDDDDPEAWIEPIDAPVRVECEFRFPAAQKRIPAARLYGRIWHHVRHDIDKLERTVLDALENAGVVVNDKKVVKIASEKYEYPPEALAGMGKGWHDGGVIVKLWEVPEYPEREETTA